MPSTVAVVATAACVLACRTVQSRLRPWSSGGHVRMSAFRLKQLLVSSLVFHVRSTSYPQPCSRRVDAVSSSLAAVMRQFPTRFPWIRSPCVC